MPGTDIKRSQLSAVAGGGVEAAAFAQTLSKSFPLFRGHLLQA